MMVGCVTSKCAKVGGYILTSRFCGALPDRSSDSHIFTQQPIGSLKDVITLDGKTDTTGTFICWVLLMLPIVSLIIT